MEGRLRPAHVEPFKGMGTIRTNADLHVEDERQRRIGRDVHEDGAVLLFLGGNGEIAVPVSYTHLTLPTIRLV